MSPSRRDGRKLALETVGRKVEHGFSPRYLERPELIPEQVMRAWRGSR